MVTGLPRRSSLEGQLLQQGLERHVLGHSSCQRQDKRDMSANGAARTAGNCEDAYEWAALCSDPRGKHGLTSYASPTLSLLFAAARDGDEATHEALPRRTREARVVLNLTCSALARALPLPEPDLSPPCSFGEFAFSLLTSFVCFKGYKAGDEHLFGDHGRCVEKREAAERCAPNPMPHVAHA